MKKQISTIVKTALGFCALVAVMHVQSVRAQAPEKMSYQAVIRNAANELVTVQNVGMQVSVLQGSANGSPVYVETHNASTNDNGLVSLELGTGTVVSGVFANINWGAGPFFLKAETDPTGGTNYTITGTSQLISVPYALHAKNGVPSGATQGQVLTFCDGEAVWTDDGECPTPVSPFPQGYVHCNPNNPTQVVDVTNPITGATWMDRNLGANRAATSSTDAESYGSLFQWGRGADGHQCVNRYAGDGVTTSGTTATLSSSDTPGHGNFITISTSSLDWRSPQNDNLWQGINGTNNPCPTGYRIPTEAELNNERLSWVQAPISSTNNSAGAFASPLKLPMAGHRNSIDGSLFHAGSLCGYWSSTVSSTTSAAHNLYFVSNNAYMVASIRAAGFSVRCIKN